MTVKVHEASQFTEHDISVEARRAYIYPDGSELVIDYPVTLFLKQDAKGDSHRIVTEIGRTYYPRRGWLGIWWINKDSAKDKPVQF